ncbi:MAG: hypothetical protein RLZZ303_2039 [Candidatus Hydrogenedentota bacterium]|jgi:predicted RNA-binding protein YlqC (UPF0109 family)
MLIEFVSKKLVENPEDVKVNEITSEDGSEVTYELRVNEADMGRIIGRSGRTAKALRTLVAAAATKADVRANLEILD